MLEIFYSPTPNGWKLTIMAEELVEAGLLKREDFKVVPIDIGKGEQFTEEYLAVSPNGKIPALRDGKQTVFESGACLLFMAEKFGNAFYPQDKKYEVLQWLCFQIANVGPIFGQVSHFVNYAPLIDSRDHSYSLERYQREFKRLLSVMDKQLGKFRFLACDEYTIADIATFGWVTPYKRFGADLSDYPNVQRWYNQLKGRQGVRRGLDTFRRKTKGMGQDAERQMKTANEEQKERFKNLFTKSKM